jgi:hypothetical protein
MIPEQQRSAHSYAPDILKVAWHRWNEDPMYAER